MRSARSNARRTAFGTKTGPKGLATQVPRRDNLANRLIKGSAGVSMKFGMKQNAKLWADAAKVKLGDPQRHNPKATGKQ
jgi:hypothetical protein